MIAKKFFVFFLLFFFLMKRLKIMLKNSIKKDWGCTVFLGVDWLGKEVN